MKLFGWFAKKVPPHEHVWEREWNSPYKRICPACGRREYMMWNRFPRVGEVTVKWVEVSRAKPSSVWATSAER